MSLENSPMAPTEDGENQESLEREKKIVTVSKEDIQALFYDNSFDSLIVKEKMAQLGIEEGDLVKDEKTGDVYLTIAEDFGTIVDDVEKALK